MIFQSVSKVTKSEALEELGNSDSAIERVEAKLAKWEAESSRRLAVLEENEEESFAAHQQFLTQFEQQLDHLRTEVNLWTNHYVIANHME